MHLKYTIFNKLKDWKAYIYFLYNLYRYKVINKKITIIVKNGFWKEKKDLFYIRDKSDNIFKSAFINPPIIYSIWSETKIAEFDPQITQSHVKS